MKHNIAYDDEKLKKAVEKLATITKELKDIAFDLDTLVTLEPPKTLTYVLTDIPER